MCLSYNHKILKQEQISQTHFSKVMCKSDGQTDRLSHRVESQGS